MKAKWITVEHDYITVTRVAAVYDEPDTICLKAFNNGYLFLYVDGDADSKPLVITEVLKIPKNTINVKMEVSADGEEQPDL